MNLPGPSICTAFYFLSFSGPSFIGKRLGRRRANQPQMSRFLLANRRESPMTMPTEAMACRSGCSHAWPGARCLSLRHRSTIFPDVYEALAKQRADVLVTHE